MILSDTDLKWYIKSAKLSVIPLQNDTIRENGLDLRLSNEIGRHLDNYKKYFILDPENKSHLKKTYKIKKLKQFIIKPQEQILLSTKERLELPNDLVGFVELRSSWARHGLSLPPTIIDAGFKGTITLEVINNAPYSILLRKNYRFAHIVFLKTINNVSKSYRGFYQNQNGIKIPKKMT